MNSVDERKKRLDKKGAGQGEASAEDGLGALGERGEEEAPFANKRPKLYERKTKITGNNNFLSQIFS